MSLELLGSEIFSLSPCGPISFRGVSLEGCLYSTSTYHILTTKYISTLQFALQTWMTSRFRLQHESCKSPLHMLTLLHLITSPEALYMDRNKTWVEKQQVRVRVKIRISATKVVLRLGLKGCLKKQGDYVSDQGFCIYLPHFVFFVTYRKKQKRCLFFWMSFLGQRHGYLFRARSVPLWFQTDSKTSFARIGR